MKRPFWLDLLLLLLLPIAGLSLGVAATLWLNIAQAPYSDLVINLSFLILCLVAIAILRLSREDVGLKVIKRQIAWHIVTSLVIFALYLLFYIFAIRISSLKPLSSTMTWGVLTALVIAFTEELYFRGVLYRFSEKRFSALAALVITALIFGLFHARQGLNGIVTKTITGWLWGSVRYSSGMIFMLILPVHFAYNALWLIFEGTWNDPPFWAVYGLPTAEFLLGLAILFVKVRKSGFKQVQEDLEES